MNSLIRTLARLGSSTVSSKKKKLLLVQKCLSQLNLSIYKPLFGITPCFLTAPFVIAIPKGMKNSNNVAIGGPDKLVVEVTQFDVEENIGHLMTLARIALEKGETDKAVAILEMGIKICEEYQSYFVMPYMYDILIAISFATGNMGKAELLLVQIIEKMLQLGIPESDTQIVDFKLRLARIYSNYNESTLAELGFKSCLKDQEKKILKGDTSSRTGLLYVNVLFWYGLHKIKNDDYGNAKQLIDSAYSYSQKIKGLSPYQEMIILTTLADLNTQLEEYDIALQNLHSAILLGKGIGSLDLPKCYLKLGKIYKALGFDSTAQRWLKEAYDLAVLFSETTVADDAKQVLDGLKL